MPGFDRTGPQGQGSRTGRQMGKCNPENNEINNIERPRRGIFGFGFGKKKQDDSSSPFFNGRGNNKGQGKGRRNGMENGLRGKNK